MAEIPLTWPTSSDNGNFHVTKQGKVYATGAIYTGDSIIRGTIGNFQVYEDQKGFHFIATGDGNTVTLDETGLYVNTAKTYYFNSNGIIQCNLVITQTLSSSSDRTVKNSIQSLVLNQNYNNLNSVIFKYNENDSKYHIGFIANEIQKIFGDKYGLVNSEQEYLNLCYTDLIALNTLEIQNLQKRERELEDFIKKYIERQGD